MRTSSWRHDREIQPLPLSSLFESTIILPEFDPFEIRSPDATVSLQALACRPWVDFSHTSSLSQRPKHQEATILSIPRSSIRAYSIFMCLSSIINQKGVYSLYLSVAKSQVTAQERLIVAWIPFLSPGDVIHEHTTDSAKTFALKAPISVDLQVWFYVKRLTLNLSPSKTLTVSPRDIVSFSIALRLDRASCTTINALRAK
jgi:hypothetical protein